MEGIVKESLGQRGWGFIVVAGEEHVFVHHKDVVGNNNKFCTLTKGQKVEFICQKTAKGLKAVRVRVIE